MSDGTGELSDCGVLKETCSVAQVGIKCEYCSRTSLKLQSNCDGCGAAITVPDKMIRQPTASPALDTRLSNYVQYFIDNVKVHVDSISNFEL